MLPRGQRLTDAAGFATAVRRGRRAGGPLLVVHLARLEGQDRRIGFVVAKTVGTAVTRNRVKRRLRHLVRERIDALPASVLLVVRAQPAASSASYGELGDALDRCLHRALEA